MNSKMKLVFQNGPQIWAPTHELTWIPAHGATPMLSLVMLLPDPTDSDHLLAFTKHGWSRNQAHWRYSRITRDWVWFGSETPAPHKERVSIRRIEGGVDLTPPGVPILP